MTSLSLQVLFHHIKDVVYSIHAFMMAEGNIWNRENFRRGRARALIDAITYFENRKNLLNWKKAEKGWRLWSCKAFRRDAAAIIELWVHNLIVCFFSPWLLLVVDVSVWIQNSLYSFSWKTAGLQVYGCNELLLYFLWAKFSSCTCTGEIAKPFPMHPGIERRGVRPSCSGI